MPDDMTSEREFNERNIEEFRRNAGKVGGQFEGFPLLLLTSTGAKSGAERLNLIGYFDIDSKIYIVGSGGGSRPKPRLGVQPSRQSRCESRDRLGPTEVRRRPRIAAR